jgi:lipid-A-disaccharide synthase
MVIAGEPSGDLLAAELVRALAATDPGADAKFFGAGGPQMAEAGVELAFDLTQHAVVGLWEVLRNYTKFRRLFRQLLDLACERKPDAIICVDFSGFNRRFARAVRQRVRSEQAGAVRWHPKIIQFVSPQVWASRPGRAKAMARDFDLLLSLFPFEKQWYAERLPELRVEFVGHPLCDRFKVGGSERRLQDFPPLVLLLPGSRLGELKRHLPVLLQARQQIGNVSPATFRIVLPDERLAETARTIAAAFGPIEIQVGGLADSLARASLAIASTGTVTLECACFGVPTVTLYKTSWSTYEIGRRIIKVNSLTMPNLLAGETVFPEFIQHTATAENIARAAVELLNDEPRREAIRVKLGKIIAGLGGPGASRRAAEAIGKLLNE